MIHGGPFWKGGFFYCEVFGQLILPVHFQYRETASRPRVCFFIAGGVLIRSWGYLGCTLINFGIPFGVPFATLASLLEFLLQPWDHFLRSLATFSGYKNVLGHQRCHQRHASDISKINRFVDTMWEPFFVEYCFPGRCFCYVFVLFWTHGNSEIS